MPTSRKGIANLALRHLRVWWMPLEHLGRKLSTHKGNVANVLDELVGLGLVERAFGAGPLLYRIPRKLAVPGDIRIICLDCRGNRIERCTCTWGKDIKDWGCDECGHGYWPDCECATCLGTGLELSHAGLDPTSALVVQWAPLLKRLAE